MPPELETVDIDGVEILSAGGPYHGHGSPKGGDYFTADFLESLAKANATLTDLRPPVKIGHNAAQKLLQESGLQADEMPAAGWLSNIRPGERDGTAKLLADVKGVPKKLADLIKAGAFRTRSVEIGKVFAQSGDSAGEKLTAITALALLGAKAPAIRTLDDIVALYSEEGVDDDFGDEMTEIVVSDTRPVVEGEATLTLSSEHARMFGATLDNGSCTWTVPFRTWGDDVIELGDRAFWREEETKVMGSGTAADTDGMKIKELSDEQVRALGDTLGIDAEVEGDELRDAVADKMVDLVGAPVVEANPTPAPAPEGTVNLSSAEYADIRANLELAKSLAEERRIEKRDTVVVGAVEKGKLPPAEVETWRALYDANPEAASKAIEEMPVNADLLRALGSEGEGEGSPDGVSDAEEAEYRAFAASLGIGEE